MKYDISGAEENLFIKIKQFPSLLPVRISNEYTPSAAILELVLLPWIDMGTAQTSKHSNMIIYRIRAKKNLMRRLFSKFDSWRSVDQINRREDAFSPKLDKFGSEGHEQPLRCVYACAQLDHFVVAFLYS